MNIKEFHKLLDSDETEYIEFKEAKNQYDTVKAIKYCVALANEGGGKFILGVTNRKPRMVVGTKAFENIGKIKEKIFNHINWRVRIEEYFEDEKRVLIFHVPGRPIGTPLSFKGKYLMRINESLQSMSSEQLKEIFSENVPDFSSKICYNAKFSDISHEALNELRKRIFKVKRFKQDISNISDEQLLNDLGLMDGRAILYAALILLGNEIALRKYLPNSEIIYEYRLNSNSLRPDDSLQIRKALILQIDEIWEKVNSKNLNTSILEGFLLHEVKIFNEKVIREAILNATSHRDYNDQRSIFIKQCKESIVIENPGGFLSGINPENIIIKQMPRNRRLCEALRDIGYVEKAGQGADLMFSQQILEGKSIPDYSDSEPDCVRLRLSGVVENLDLLKIIEKKFADYEDDIPVQLLIETYYSEQTFRSLSKVEKDIIYAIQINNQITVKELSQKILMSTTSIDKYISRLKKDKIISRTGSKRKGCWHILLKSRYI